MNTAEIIEKLNEITEKYLDKVNEKLSGSFANTQMVHEDIRIIHHLIKMKKEINEPVPSLTSQQVHHYHQGNPNHHNQ